MKYIIHISYLLLLLISFQWQTQGQNLPLACTGSKVRYAVKGSANSVFDWEIQGGTIIQNYNDSVDIQWNDKATLGVLKVTEHTAYKCIGSPEYARVVLNTPQLTLVSGVKICQGQTVDVVSGGNFKHFLWSTGDTTQYFKVSEDGWYRLKATDDNGCSAVDSVYVTVSPLPKVNLGRDTSLCDNTLLLDAGTDGTFYSWSTGSIEQTLLVSDEKKGQTISVKVRNDDGCVNSDTINILPCHGTQLAGIPNTFTPNGDSFNDTWKIPGLDGYPNAVIEIYDRWGRMVFQSKHGLPDNGWDGNLRGKPLPMDSYYYIINLNNGTEPIPGTVTIIR